MPGSKAAVKPKKPRAYKLPKHLPEGEVLTEHSGKRQWRIGAIIGQGGFGYIYLASDDVTQKVNSDAQYVLKIEPQGNGPLFVELHFYQRAAKEEMLENFRKSQKLAYLGVPKFISTGLHETNKMKYRFMVMQRFGEDLYKKLKETNGKFTPKVTYMLAKRILNTLEYLHESGYIHADIKAANLMMGYGTKASNQVFLVDYGLAHRYMPDGKHKPYKEDPRKAHDGTLEYTSIDAHKGVLPSRRADIEILGYNIVHWLSGRLPWQAIKEADQVSAMKQKLMSNGSLMKECFAGQDFAGKVEVEKYLKYTQNLKYEEKPDYKRLKKMFEDALTKNRLKDDGKFTFESVITSPVRTNKPKAPKITSSEESSPEKKKKRSAGTKRKATSSSSADDQVKKPAAGTKRKTTSSSSADDLGKEQMPKVKKPGGNRRVKKAVCSISSPESLPEVKKRSPTKKPAIPKGKPVKKTSNRSSKRKVQTMDTEIQTSPGLLQRYIDSRRLK